MDIHKREEVFADELLIVRHSGEIPEVALHSSLYYLTKNPAGPGFELNKAESLELKKMVVERYREIIRRDLKPDNRDKSFYRGIARCITNWRRLDKFCTTEGFDHDPIRNETGKALIKFINTEICEVAEKCRCSSVNCTVNELEFFIEEMQLDCKTLAGDWRKLCMDSKE